MALKFKYESKDAIPEDQLSFYVERDGAFVLDVDGLDTKTADDVQRLKASIEKERTEHKTTKEKLRAWGEFGDIDDVRERIEENETLRANGGGKSGEELLNARKQLRAKEKEFNEYKEKTEPIVQEAETLRASSRRNSIERKVREALGTIDQKFDGDKLFNVLLDKIELKQIDLDELGDLKTSSGKPFKDVAESIASTFNFVKPSTPGGSKPGDKKLADAARDTLAGESNLIDDEVAGMLS